MNKGVHEEQNEWSFVKLFHIFQELLHFTFPLPLNMASEFLHTDQLSNAIFYHGLAHGLYMCLSVQHSLTSPSMPLPKQPEAEKNSDGNGKHVDSHSNSCSSCSDSDSESSSDCDTINRYGLTTHNGLWCH